MAAERPTRRMLGETLRPAPTLAKAADALNVYSHALAAAHAPVLKRAHHIAGAIERDDALMRLATVASSVPRRGMSDKYKPLAPSKATPDAIAERSARAMTRAAKKDTLSKVVDNSDIGKSKAT